MTEFGAYIFGIQNTEKVKAVGLWAQNQGASF